MKQITLSLRRAYRIWRPGWQVGTNTLLVSFFCKGVNFEAPRLNIRLLGYTGASWLKGTDF